VVIVITREADISIGCNISSVHIPISFAREIRRRKMVYSPNQTKDGLFPKPSQRWCIPQTKPKMVYSPNQTKDDVFPKPDPQQG
jgi:hypothetical protein